MQSGLAVSSFLLSPLPERLSLCVCVSSVTFSLWAVSHSVLSAFVFRLEGRTDFLHLTHYVTPWAKGRVWNLLYMTSQAALFLVSRLLVTSQERTHTWNCYFLSFF